MEPPRTPRRSFAIASLVLGILSVPTVGLVLVGALLSVIFGVVALVKQRDAPAEYGGRSMAIAGIVLSAVSLVIMPFVLGVAAAIAIPSFLRARVSANEAAAIADVRAVVDAEQRYARSNGGYFDSLSCLARPSACLPGHRGDALIEERLEQDLGMHKGYRRTFHPGMALEGLPPTLSRSSFRSFAYVAVPEVPGRTGVRSFCGDSAGTLCARSGRELELESGLCPADCRTLR